MKKISLILLATLLLQPLPVNGELLEGDHLRMTAVEETWVQSGIEEVLRGWTPQSRWIPRRRIRDEMVAWGAAGSPATIKGVQRALRQGRVTWEEYLQTRDFLAAPPAAPGAGSLGAPRVFDATDPATRRQLANIEQEAVEHFGVVIIAGALFPLMPVSGKPPLQVQLESLNSLEENMGVDIPVVLVADPFYREELQDFLREHGNFGLRQLRLLTQELGPSLNREGKVLLSEYGQPLLKSRGTGGGLRVLARNGTLQWFRERLGQGGRLFLDDGNFLLDENFFCLVAGVSAETEALQVGNEGLGVFPLKGLEGNLARLQPQAVRDSQGAWVEYNAAGLLREYGETGLLLLRDGELAAMRTPEEVERMEVRALAEGRQAAMGRGIDLDPAAQVEFHPAFSGRVGHNVKIRGNTSVYFGRDRVYLQQGKRLVPLRGTPDVPTGAVISSVGFVKQELPVPQLGVDGAARLEIGQRETQEDTHQLALLQDSGRPAGVLAAIADGIGGGPDGELASQRTISNVSRLLSRPEVLLAVRGKDGGRILDRLKQSILVTNVRVREELGRNASEGSGSTLSLALLTGENAFTASVGNSRIYRFSQGRLELITADQSAWWERAAGRLQRGQLSPGLFNLAVANAVRGGRFQGPDYLRQCMGMPGVPDVQLGEVPLLPGDYLVLMSDGIIDMVDEGQFAAVLADGPSAEEATQRIMDLAQLGGDNRAVIVLRQTGFPPPQQVGAEERLQQEWLRYQSISTGV